MKKAIIVLISVILVSFELSVFAEEVALPNDDEKRRTDQATEQLLQNVPEGQTYSQVFPDAMLANSVAAAAGKKATDVVTQEDLNKITTLSITASKSNPVADLEGIQYLTQLSSFMCINSNISDVSPLRSLPQLTQLWLRSGHAITDITPLASLTNLQYLDMGDCNINDLSALKNMVHLTSLYLDNNNITDVSPLSSLAVYQPNMRIDVSMNQIADISPLAGFKSSNLALDNQLVTSMEFIATSANKVKMPYLIKGLDGQAIAPRYVSPKGGVMETGTDGKNYIVWPKDAFMAAESGKQIFVYIEFGDPSQHAFNGKYRVFADYLPPSLTADSEITYPEGSSVSAEQFLKDVHAKTDEGCTMETDVTTAVQWDTPGDYQVHIRSTAPDTNMKSEIEVTVHIAATGPALTSDDEITYVQGTTQSSEQFLKDIHAATDPNAALTSDFDSVVQMSTPGDYTVEIKAVSDAGERTKQVVVHVIPYDLSIEQSLAGITFKTTDLASKEMLIKRDEKTPYTITIKDTRAGDAKWRLKMSLAQPLTSESSGATLDNALIYRDKRGRDTILQPDQAVLIGDNHTAVRSGDTFKIEWSENEGILFKMNLSSAKAETYSATFNWILEDTP